MSRPVSVQLQLLVRSAGGAPLLTHYGPAGERTELSVASFANWVAKTVNLLDDLGVGEGDVVDLAVLASRPAHWMGLVWPFALWQAGLPAHVGADAPDVAVLGPDALRPVAPTTLACSLDPWGRPLTGLPAGVLDFSSEALAQPDAASVRPADAEAPAWSDADRTLSVADLAALDPVADRVLARPATAWDAVSLVARAVLGGGSVVLLEGTAEPARTASAERARVLA